MDFVPIAKSDHQLLQLPVPLTAQDLARFPPITVADRHISSVANRPAGVAANWTFTTVDAAMEAIAVGVGYGWLPLDSVHKALESGLLSRLPLSTKTVRQTALYIVIDNESKWFDQTVSTLAQSILAECGVENL